MFLLVCCPQSRAVVAVNDSCYNFSSLGWLAEGTFLYKLALIIRIIYSVQKKPRRYGKLNIGPVEYFSTNIFTSSTIHYCTSCLSLHSSAVRRITSSHSPVPDTQRKSLSAVFPSGTLILLLSYTTLFPKNLECNYAKNCKLN